MLSSLLALLALHPLSTSFERAPPPPIFDEIYLINLDRHPYRKATIFDRLLPYGITPTRVSGIDGSRLDISSFDKLLNTHRLQGHEIGCMLSHLAIMEDALRHRLIWVLEDDIRIERNPLELAELIQITTEHDPKWDILYTDRIELPSDAFFWIYPPAKQRQSAHSSKDKTGKIERISRRPRTHSMILSKRGIRKIYAYFSNMWIDWPYDLELFKIGGLRAYQATQNYVTDDPSLNPAR